MSLGATGTLGGTGLEAVTEAAVDVAQRAHTAAAGGLAALGLLTPVDCHRKSATVPASHIHFHCLSRQGMRTLAGLSSRVAAVGTDRLLDVERPLS